ncbi:MAG: histidinol-phosphatase [Treponema sp.]|nr:histidinol-phosphatase [Candidatus Treponema equifaecale]
MNHIFHVHTWRCKHASDEVDEQYIKTALSLGANGITFTDHSPFPEDIFNNRMELSQLPEYVESLKKLRSKYKSQIAVQIGLEVEFLPSMLDFYHQLKNDYDLDLLVIGQHFYEHTDGKFSFADEKEFNKLNEFSGCGTAMIQGIKTGLFSVVAHPDRIFRRCKEWTPEMTGMAENIIKTAAENKVIMECNLSSYEKYVTKTRSTYWRNEFWQLVEDFNLSSEVPVEVIYGVDAHSSEEMISRIKYADTLQYLSAMHNINALRKEALSKFPDGLTLDEINAEIDAYRKGL